MLPANTVEWVPRGFEHPSWETKASTTSIPPEPWLITELYNGLVTVYDHQRGTIVMTSKVS